MPCSMRHGALYMSAAQPSCFARADHAHSNCSGLQEPDTQPNLGRPPVANAVKPGSTNTPSAAGDSGRSCEGAAGSCDAAPQGDAAKQQVSGQGSQQGSLAEVHMHSADLGSNQVGSTVQQSSPGPASAQPSAAGLPQAGSRDTACHSPQQAQEQQQQMQVKELLVQHQQEQAEQQVQAPAQQVGCGDAAASQHTGDQPAAVGHQQQQQQQPAPLAASPASFAASAAAQADVPGLQQAADGTEGLQWPAELMLMQLGSEAEDATHQPERAHRAALLPLARLTHLADAIPPTAAAQHVAAPRCSTGTPPRAEATASPTAAAVAAAPAAIAATAASARPASGVPELPVAAEVPQTAPASMAAGPMHLPSSETRPQQQPGQLSETSKVRLVSIQEARHGLPTVCSAAVITVCRHGNFTCCD